MIKGIVFDLDGTLVDSLSATFEAFNHAFIQFGGREHTPQEIMSHFGPGEGQIFAKILGADKAQGAYEAAKAYLDANLHRVPLHTGVEALLLQLKSAGVPISIFTGRSWDTTELILKHHRFLEHFITVIANDHVNAPKPAPEGLLLAASRMKLRPEEVLFVGDSSADIISSRAAGSQGVAALWDLLASRKSLEPYRPHHWAQTPSEIWEIWNRVKAES